MILLILSCKDKNEESSPTNPSCTISDVSIVPGINPVTITPGEDIMIDVEVSINSNCHDFLTNFVLGPGSDKINNNSPYITGCENNNCLNNTGNCSILLIVPLSVDTGTHLIEIKADVYGGTDVVQHATNIANLEVIVNQIGSFILEIQNEVKVSQGWVTSVSSFINRSGSHTGDISLSLEGLPDLTTYYFEPNPLPGDFDTSELVINAEYNALPGEYLVTAFGSDGQVNSSDTLTLFVVEPFSLSLSQDSITIQQGMYGALIVHLSRVEGYSIPIDLSAEGNIVGQGINASFNPDPVEGIISELTIYADSLLPTGSYPLSITGSVNQLEKNATLYVLVEED